MVDDRSDTPFSQAEAEEERLEAMVGPPGLWRESRWFQVDFLRSRGLRRDQSVLDIGCGPLRGGIPIIDYLDSGGYTGIDVRREVIDEARVQVRVAGLEDRRPTLEVSDDFGEGLGGRRFDMIWCFQVLYHLDDDLVDRFLAQIVVLLESDGVAYANVTLGPRKSGTWKEFPFTRRPLLFYMRKAFEHGLMVGNLGELGGLGYTERARGRRDHMLVFAPSR